MRLRIPISIIVGRKLRICIVARFSTDEQKKRRRSNVSQIKFCKKEIESELSQLGISAFIYIVVEDEAISGEVKERPGITKLRAGIDRREFDLILCEDSSRLYRNSAFCYEIVARAVDKDIRVICFGDDVDTAEQDWVQRLQEAQLHHSKDNAFTRRRLRRTLEDLWDLGAAVGPLRTGYIRCATKSATTTAKTQGPYFDHPDPQHAPHVRCAFKLAASGRDLKIAARYLTARKVPKRDGKISKWNVKNVIAMIRNEVYRGRESYSKSKSRQKKLTGETQQCPNASDQVWWRDMPHYRLVSDGLWNRANQAIDKRKKCPAPPKGESHPQFGVPRESRTPMSGLLYCQVCQGKMYCVGQSYRCQCVHTDRELCPSKHPCWNHATASRPLTHERIYGRVVHELLGAEGNLDVLIDYLAEVLADEKDLHSEASRLEREIAGLRRDCDKLSDAIEQAGQAPKMLVEKITAKERLIGEKEAELSDVRQLLAERVVVPDRAMLVEALNNMAGQLPQVDSEARDILKELLVGPIYAVPYRLLDSDRIVLRAHFTLNLVALCPEELRERLHTKVSIARGRETLQVPCVVDLFETPKYVVRALEAAELWKPTTLEKPTALENIGRQFGFSKRTATRSKDLGMLMRENGLLDAYVRLDGPPASGSRWHRFNQANAS